MERYTFLKKYLGGALQRKSLTLAFAALVLSLLSVNLAAKDKTPTPETKSTPTAKVTVVPTAALTPVAKKADASGSATSVSKTATPTEVAKVEDHHKSAVLASSLAFIPGIAIHGVGHMYAGSWVKGVGLFLVGSGGAAIAAYEGVHGYDDIKTLVNDVNGGSIPTDLSPALSKIGIIVVGTASFLFTWFDDMSGAPLAVDRYNKRIDDATENSHAELNVLPTSGGAQLVYTAKF